MTQQAGPSGRRSPTTGMKTREFLALLPQRVEGQLPQTLSGFHVRGPLSSLVKLYYGGSDAIHYEVWVQRRQGQIELGLHFEADPETNGRCLTRLVESFVSIRRELGPAAEPEQWTPSWTRIHETIPLELLDQALLRRVASRLARYIKTLQPLLDTPGPPASQGIDPPPNQAYNVAT